jgi:Mrp family chromosome partitioning ATPase
MPDEKALKKQRLAIDAVLSRITYKLLVMSGKGGVGKSTVAANLSLTLAGENFKVGLMDVDLHGPDIPRLLGLKEEIGIEPDGRLRPLKYSSGLKVISIEALVQDRDTAFIWKGPRKIGAIRQFLSDVNWGDLDFLIIDSPPGTGDELLGVAQSIKGVKAVIVTTPQELSISDVKKSINFCKKIGVTILGIIENMSGLICPHCGGEIDLFKKGGGEDLARLLNYPFLGRIPLDPQMVRAGDAGIPFVQDFPQSPAAQAFKRMAGLIRQRLTSQDQPLQP